MTTTLDHPTTTTAGPQRGEVFLWGPGYDLTAREIIDALGSYLSAFGDNFGPGGVSPLDAIHAEVIYTANLTAWRHRRAPEQVATIRARAETIARDFFDGHFPTITW